MTVASVTEAVKDVMGTSCEGVRPAPASTGKPFSGIGLPGLLQSEGVLDDPDGLSAGFCGGRKERGSKCKIVHNQVLRIRKEDHRLGKDDIREGLGAREQVAFVQVSTGIGVLFFARPILPSPLGIK